MVPACHVPDDMGPPLECRGLPDAEEIPKDGCALRGQAGDGEDGLIRSIVLEWCLWMARARKRSCSIICSNSSLECNMICEVLAFVRLPTALTETSF